MSNNAVHPGGNPPDYSDQPPSAGPSTDSVYVLQQQQPQPGPPPQSAWNDPNVSQYPPAGYPQYPPPTGPGAYGAPYYAPPPPQPQQQQQQQQVVVVNAGQPQAIVVRETESFVGQMILACFVMWCCNWLFGLVAFVLAGERNFFRY